MNIEHAIPMPVRNVIPDELVAVFERMTSGDSTIVLDTNIQSLRQRLRRNDISITVRVQSEGYRVWKK